MEKARRALDVMREETNNILEKDLKLQKENEMLKKEEEQRRIRISKKINQLVQTHSPSLTFVNKIIQTHIEPTKTAHHGTQTH